MSEKPSVIGIILGRVIGGLIFGAIIAYPLAQTVNYVFSTAALVAIFGGYLTCWKAFVLTAMYAVFFK